MAEQKTKTTKEETKKYWKITGPSWSKPVLRPKVGTSEKSLKALKAKKGYKVEEA